MVNHIKMDIVDSEIKLFYKVYEKFDSRLEAQEYLSEIFNVTPRGIRKWAKKLNLGLIP